MKNLTKALIASSISMAIFTPAYAQDTQKNWTVGGGLIVYQSAFEGEGAKVQPFPLISYDNGDYFINGQDLGYHFIKNTNNGIFVDVIGSLNAAARPNQTSVNFDLGLKAGYANENIYFDISVLQDVSAQHNGQRAIATIAKPIHQGRLSIIPSLSAEWMSRKAANYNYGISTEQNADMIKDNRKTILPVYEIESSTVNINATLILSYQVSDSWSAVAIGGAKYLGNKIRDNPSIVKDYELFGGAGLTYSF